jgi:hypothetical protein
MRNSPLWLNFALDAVGEDAITAEIIYKMTSRMAALLGGPVGFFGTFVKDGAVQDRSFVVIISERAMSGSVENIGKGLLALGGKGITSGARSLDAVLHDVLRGVRDDVLLKTQLEPADLEALLRKQIGRDLNLCTIKWV